MMAAMSGNVAAAQPTPAPDNESFLTNTAIGSDKPCETARTLDPNNPAPGTFHPWTADPEVEPNCSVYHMSFVPYYCGVEYDNPGQEARCEAGPPE